MRTMDVGQEPALGMREERKHAFAGARRPGKFALILLAAACLQANGCMKGLKKESEETPTAGIEEAWGVQIEGIRLSAAGYMLDFRYRVIDPEKAAPLFNRQVKPHLLDQASGARLMVPNPPKVGPLRTSDTPRADTTYFMLFANPGQLVKPGNAVTVTIGDFSAKDLTVE